MPINFDFDKGWKRIERILLYAGIGIGLTVTPILAFGVGIMSLFFIPLALSPFVLAKITKWIIDGFRGKGE